MQYNEYKMLATVFLFASTYYVISVIAYLLLIIMNSVWRDA